MIEVRHLTKDYGPHRAIDNLNFTLNKGDVVGFLGPNGAGKSTTMKIITGFMAPTSGEALVGGFDVFENPIEVKRRIGYLPETPPVYLDMSVQDYLQYVAELKGVEKNKKSALVARAIEKTNLGSVQKRMIGNLSKGFRQRVGIAQALVSDPDVLILDEPTVGLDPKQVAEIRDLIQELRGQHTIILSTHILSEVQAVCEKAIIINKGRIVAQDTIENLSRVDKGQLRLHIRLAKDLNLSQTLGGAQGIVKIESPKSKEWLVDVSGGDEVLENISGLIVQAKGGLLELTPSKLDLEDVFLKLTYGQDSGVPRDPQDSATNAISTGVQGGSK